MSHATVEQVHVVVPAHDERRVLGRQLTAIESALTHARHERPRLSCSVTVVLDCCTDGSADVVARFPAVHGVEARVGCVGTARRLGVEHARRAHPSDPSRTWVACTDADSEVPGHWLHTQLALAETGSQLVLGTVWPDPLELEPGRLAHWWSLHRLRDGHPYVHGANLGFTLAAYDAAGGFGDLEVGEDVDLVQRIKVLGVSWAATSRMPVLTSGRLGGRAPGGFASYLLALAR
jgi:hypothetical protein